MSLNKRKITYISKTFAFFIPACEAYVRHFLNFSNALLDKVSFFSISSFFSFNFFTIVTYESVISMGNVP